MKSKKIDISDRYSVGTHHDVTVEHLDGHPAAPARDHAHRLFRVPGGVPGDQLCVEIVAKGRKEFWSEIRQIEVPGKARVTPPCKLTSQCGGCPWQSVSYEQQLLSKTEMVIRALNEHPELAQAQVKGPTGLQQASAYRTKIQMPFGGEAGNLYLGFYAPRSHRLIPVTHCLVQHPQAEVVRHKIISVLNKHHIPPYREDNASGDLRYLLLRVAPQTNQLGAVLVVKSLSAFDWAVMAAELESIDELTGVWINENPTTGNAVLGQKTVHLAGKRRLDDVICGIEFERNPMSFFQTNHEATEQLFSAVKSFLNEPITTLFDLYAGGGLFALALAEQCRQLVLIEAHPDAVIAAKATLNKAGVKDAAVHQGRVEEVLTRLTQQGIAADAIIADPPRSGIMPRAIEAMVATGANRIIYVSCNLKSLRRDLLVFATHAIHLKQVHCVDMFPHTPHMELVCLLER